MTNVTVKMTVKYSRCSIIYSTLKMLTRFSLQPGSKPAVLVGSRCAKSGKKRCMPDQLMTGHSHFYCVPLSNNNKRTFSFFLLFQYITVWVICNIISQGRYILSQNIWLWTVRPAADYMVFILTYLVHFAFYSLLGQDVIWELSRNSLIQYLLQFFCYWLRILPVAWRFWL